MKYSRKERLISLEDHLIRSMAQYNDYETDLTLNKDDFSKEILLIKVLNNFDRYKRAFQQFKLKIDNLKILEDQINSKIVNLPSDRSPAIPPVARAASPRPPRQETATARRRPCLNEN